MGYKIVDHIINNIHLPKQSQKLTLIVIGRFADETTYMCWPSNNTIAKLSGISVRHVKRVMHDLIGLGYISIVRKGGGRAKTNTIKLNLSVIPLHNSTPKNDSKDKVTQRHPISRQATKTGSIYPDKSPQKNDIKPETRTFSPSKDDTVTPESIKEAITEAKELNTERTNIFTEEKASILTKPTPPPEWKVLLSALSKQEKRAAQIGPKGCPKIQKNTSKTRATN